MTPPCNFAATANFHGGVRSPRPRFYGCNNITGKPHEGFPLWGKLSPQVTDEGESAGGSPLIRRVPRHLPPKGKASPCGRFNPHFPAPKPSSYLKTHFSAIFAIFQATTVILKKKIARYTINIAGKKLPTGFFRQRCRKGSQNAALITKKESYHYADECRFYRKPKSRVGKAGR